VRSGNPQVNSQKVTQSCSVPSLLHPRHSQPLYFSPQLSPILTMPRNPTKLATPISDGDENTEYLACFIKKLQRSNKEKRRLQREKIETSYTRELERVRAGAIIAIDAAEKEVYVAVLFLYPAAF
jgi:hypothetical protein